VPFEQLSPADQQFARDILAQTQGEYRALAQKFLASSSSNRRLAGELLANILKSRSECQLFLVGDRPVAAGWGLTSIYSRSGGGSPAKAISYSLRAGAADFSEEELPDEPPAEPPAEPPDEPREAEAQTVPKPLAATVKILTETKKVRGFWYWWPLWLLLGLALILFLMWGFLFGSFPFKLPFWPGAADQPEEELVIPEEAASRGDFSFMEGCWNSSSRDLVNTETRLPIVVKYCFDRKGRAEVTVDESDRQGRFTQTCRTTAAASYEGGVLIIRDEGSKCPDGRGYYQAVLNCRAKSAGRGVACSIIQDEMDEIIQADFTRAR
jgi:hypothetical protein